jgi:hypothetical protein
MGHQRLRTAACLEWSQGVSLFSPKQRRADTSRVEIAHGNRTIKQTQRRQTWQWNECVDGGGRAWMRTERKGQVSKARRVANGGC